MDDPSLITTLMLDIYSTLLHAMVTYTGGIFTALQTSFWPFAVLLAALYFVIVGINILKGHFGELTKEFTTSIILLVLLSSAVFTSGAYAEYVVSTITDTVNGFGTFFIQAGAKSFNNSAGGFEDVLRILDQNFAKINTVCDKYNAHASLLNPLAIFQSLRVAAAALILAGIYLICVVTFLFLNLSSWFAIYIMIVIGGVCIFFASFKQTRFIFYAWLRAICNFGLVIVFASIIMSICVTAISNSIDLLANIDPDQGGIFTVEYFAAVIICALCFCMLLKAPDFAAMLSGGSAGSTAAIAAGIGMATGKIYKEIKTGGAGRAAGAAGAASGGRGKPTPALGAYSRRKGFEK